LGFSDQIDLIPLSLTKKKPKSLNKFEGKFVVNQGPFSLRFLTLEAIIYQE